MAGFGNIRKHKGRLAVSINACSAVLPIRNRTFDHALTMEWLNAGQHIARFMLD
jgi:hypothetical protein